MNGTSTINEYCLSGFIAFHQKKRKVTMKRERGGRKRNKEKKRKK